MMTPSSVCVRVFPLASMTRRPCEEVFTVYLAHPSFHFSYQHLLSLCKLLKRARLRLLGQGAQMQLRQLYLTELVVPPQHVMPGSYAPNQGWKTSESP